jgi:hypothetical protein
MNDISTPQLARKKIANGAEYIESLRGRGLTIWLFGEKIEEPVDHPIIRPSINALARTYDLAVEHPELASVVSPFTGERVSRFLHICTSAPDLVAQNKIAAPSGAAHGHLLPALCRAGRVQCAVLGDVRDRRAVRHAVPRAIEGFSHRHAPRQFRRRAAR